MDLSIFSLDTLAAMKHDAVMLFDPNVGATKERLVVAFRVIDAIDDELDARIKWVDDVRAALSATV